MFLDRTTHYVWPWLLWCCGSFAALQTVHAGKDNTNAALSIGLNSSPVMASDVLLLRAKFDAHSDVPPLIQVAHVAQKHPQWWTWLPKTTKALQKKSEQLYVAHLAKNRVIPVQYQRILRSFWARHLPVSLDGWTVYRRLVSPAVFVQRLKHRLSSATPESYCTLYKAYYPLLHRAAPPQLASLLVNLNFGSVVPVKRLWAALVREPQKGMPVLPEHRLLAQLLGSVPCAHPLEAYETYAHKRGRPSPWITPLTVAAILHCIRHNHSQKAYDLFLTLPKTSMDPKTTDKLATMVKRQLWQEGQKWEVKGRLVQARSWYRLALQVPLQGSPSDRMHAEYLHGLVCLFGLNNPQKAMGHFLKSTSETFSHQQLHPEAMAKSKHPLRVLTPLGVQRHDVAALFWLGACAHRLGKSTLAKRYWDNASRYALFGYGQWALWMLKRPMAVSFPAQSPSTQGWKSTPLQLCQHIVDVWTHYAPKATLALVYDTTYPLCLDIMSLSQSPESLSYTLRMIQHMYPQYVTESGNILGKHYAGMFQATYPTPLLKGMRQSKDDPSVIYSIVRTESGFRPTTMAQTVRETIKGYMMIRPMTAEFITKKNHLIFDKKRFQTDPSYHIFLGSLIIENLWERSLGSYPVAIAAYNGGMAATQQWLLSIPVKSSDPLHALYWMESIPFAETRHYVMRVLETYGIYRTLLKKPISVKEWGKLMTIHRSAASVPSSASQASSR